MHPTQRSHFKNSIFIEAMENGDWILLDDIQFAPSEIAEKISPLCEYGDNRELNIIECCENFHFTGKKLPNTRLIHEDFRLFITYNPTSRIETKQLDPVLLNKCAQFTLPPIDSTPESSAQLIFGSLIQSFSKEPSLYIAKRAANFHEFIKNKCKDNKDLFAGDHQITARRLNFIIKEFKNHVIKNENDPMNDIYKPIFNSIYYYYWLSYINQNDKDFKEQMITEFCKDPNEQQFENLWSDDLVSNDKYEDILILLRNIQYCAKNKKAKTIFKFNNFIEKCINVQVIDVPFILLHISDTIDFISKSDYENNYLDTNLDKEFFQLKIVERIFNDIKDKLKQVNEEFHNLMLKEIYTYDKINYINKPISRLILLSKLTSDDSKCFSCNIPRILFNDNFVDLMRFIYKMVESDKIINPFKTLMNQLNKNPNYIPLIESRIPYNHFNDTKFNMINYIMPIIRMLHESQTSFHIIVADEHFDFDYFEQSKFEPFLFFENNDILTISNKSYIAYNDKQIKFELENDDPKMINSFFYNEIVHMLNPDKSIVMEENSDPREKQVPQFSLLLSCNDEISLVSNIWPILYSFSYDNIKIFYNFLQEFEQETIQLFDDMYNNFKNSNVDDIFEFTKMMLNFGNKQSCLWEIKNKAYNISVKMNLKQEEEKITEEIKSIEESVKKIKFEKCDMLIKCMQLLEKQKEEINIKILKEQQSKENKEHYKKLESIINQLESLQIKNEKQENLRSKIIKQVNSNIINKTDLTEEKVLELNKLAEKFMRSVNNSRKDPESQNNKSINKNDEIALYMPDYSKPMPSFIQQSMLLTSGGEMEIKRALYRIINMDKSKYIFEIYENKKPHKILHNDLVNTAKTQLPIYQLIKHGLYFANIFINAASEIDIPRSKFAVNILVDCSSLISDTIKMFHMVLICGLTHALNSLSIKYSVAVIADMNFRCVIKEFDDPHSPVYLQKICDCLLIKRFRTKLLSSVKFAIDNMSYKNNERPYRAIFTFSSGLDEQLLLPNIWLKYIKQNENLSYGFVFSMPPTYTDKEVDILQKMWYSFENATNNSCNLKISSNNIKNNEKSGLDIIDFSTSLAELFTTIMQRKINKDDNKSNANKFENASFYVDELTDINRITSFLNINFNNLNEIYVNSKPPLISKNIIIDKLDTKVYRNILRKILKCQKSANVNSDELIKKLIINKNDVDLISLETIFKPNKASQLILSTTGTEIDFTALVLNLLNPVPEPMIFLEEKGGWIRNYAVSIVIDPSLSCFDDLSGPHSMQTIKNILSSLSILDISCFDLIVAGNPNPIIICSDIGTIYALSNESSLYDSMFAALQNPIPNPDLGSAIHTIFDIGKLRSSEYTSFLFVLTNGMYQSDERSKIIDSVNMCIQNGIITFGIGIGLYPKGIENLFPRVVYAKNPSNVMKAIAYFYGDQIPYLSKKEMTSIDLVPDIENLFKAFDNLIDKEKNPVFKQLKEELESITPFLDAFDDIYNHERKKYNAKKIHSKI